MHSDLADLPLADRVVLLGLASLEAAGETPAHAPAIRQACREHADDLAETVVGTLDEATVARALNELEAEGYAEREQDGTTSVVGKGRPAFALSNPVGDVLAALSDDESVSPAVASVRDDD